MATVTITINSRNYEIACKDGQEGRIMELGKLISSKASSLGNSVHIGESLSLVMTSLILADELSEVKNSKGVVEVPVEQKMDLSVIDESLSKELSEVSNAMKGIASVIKKM